MTSPTEFTVRRAVPDDAPALAELAARLFEQAFGAANEPENMRMYVSSAFSTDTQAAELADASRATWIAYDNEGRAVGYAMLRRGSRAPGVTGENTAELQRIYADRSWHGRGVGDR